MTISDFVYYDLLNSFIYRCYLSTYRREKDKNTDLSVKIRVGFGPHCLGILFVADVRGKLRSLSLLLSFSPTLSLSVICFLISMISLSVSLASSFLTHCDLSLSLSLASSSLISLMSLSLFSLSLSVFSFLISLSL